MELVNTAKRFDELKDLNVIVYIEDHFDSKGRKINIQFRKENFPHLVGLYKLTMSTTKQLESKVLRTY